MIVVNFTDSKGKTLAKVKLDRENSQALEAIARQQKQSLKTVVRRTLDRAFARDGI